MLWARVKQILSLGAVEGSSLDLPDESAFREHARALTARNIRGASLFVVVGSLVGAGLDPLVFTYFPDVPRRLLLLRGGHALIAALGCVALSNASLARRPIFVAFSLVIAGSALTGYSTGVMGGLDSPWFHFTYAASICLLVPVMRWRERTLLGLALALSLLTGLGLSRPLAFDSPVLPPTVAFLIFMVAAGVAIGEFIYRLIEQRFHHERAQKRTARKLEVLNGTLEERVRVQTRELRMLAAHLESAREDERTRIARELHDELGQELTALRYALTFLRQRFEREPSSIRGNIEELDSLLARTTSTTRQLVSELRPRVLDDLGLGASVEWLVKRAEERSGLVCRLSLAVDRMDLAADVSIAAFRILQESLTNVVRHAQASHVEVEVVMVEDELRLSVRDDGIGLGDPSSRKPPEPGKGGMGLIGMRERAEALGGELHLESEPGRGTTVRVRLPALRPRAAAEEAA